MPHRYLLDLPETTEHPERPFQAWLTRASGSDVRVPRLCHALRRAGRQREAGGSGREAGEGIDAVSVSMGAPSGDFDLDVPWVTLVLGNECLEMATPTLDQHHLLEAFTSRLESDVIERDDAGLPPLKAMRRADESAAFVRALLKERLDAVPPAARGEGGDGLPQKSGEQPVLEEWKVRLVEATAILNDLYFRAKRAQRRPVSRWNDGVVSLGWSGPIGDGERAAVDASVGEDVARLGGRLESLMRCLDDLQQSPTADTAIDLGHIRKLVERVWISVKKEAQGAPVAVSDVQAMTEISWATLVHHTDVYPAWPELLVELCLQQDSRGVRGGHPRPAFTKSTTAESVLRKLLWPASMATAQAYGEDRESARSAAYVEYARLLVAQANLRRRAARAEREVAENPLADLSADEDEDFSSADAVVGLTPPAAMAIVTTFDLELELAMRVRFSGEPFVVAVPVHLLGRPEPGPDAVRATSMWLGYVVDPSDEREPLVAVTEPRADKWFVLSSADLSEDKRESRQGMLPEYLRVLPPDISSLGEMPFIVRLSGSPMVQLPRLSKGGRHNPEAAHLREPALRLAFDRGAENPGAEEQQARRRELRFVHAALLEEHHALRLSLPEIEIKERSGRGLPRELTLLQSDGFRRYWMLLGVPMSDSVVRLRLMAQFIAAGLMHGGPGEYLRPSRNGMALNRSQLSERGGDLLQWSEFDIVRGGIENMTEHLAHYLSHLGSSAGLATWPDEGEECEIS